jgi:alginate O-acetyltransferase complex protein AlgI
MLFNSLEYLIFLFIVLAVYWKLLKNKTSKQNILILVSSYYFYACWDWRFLTLIIFSTVVDYSCGYKIHKTKNLKARKYWLFLSVAFNIGLLGIFKYFNFFLDSLMIFANGIGYQGDPWTLKIILPVGISFYTFQTLSYSIDIYRRQLTPITNYVAFASFVSFFPQLVAGPIERAKFLLPQFIGKRIFSWTNIQDGIQMIIWGLFKKIIVADSLAGVVNSAFVDISDKPAPVLILATFLFSFQIYCDFSGYSEIALGSAKMLGINLSRNFRTPYYALSFTEFWGRWHISLSSWFKDYVYIPLGGNKRGSLRQYINLFITFLLSGLWHGASWTFVLWGAGHGLLLSLEKLIRTFVYVPQNKLFSVIRLTVTYISVCMLWIIFRANGISDVILIYKKLFSFNYIEFFYTLGSLGKGNNVLGITWDYNYDSLIYFAFLIVIVNLLECFNVPSIMSTQLTGKRKYLSYIYIISIASIIFILAGNSPNDFIYFQF